MFICLALAALTAVDGDWMGFRGPNGSGVAATAAKLPSTFGPTTNLAWKTAVPFARSSPIAVGDRVIITAAEGKQLVTLAYDAATGKQLWRASVERAREQKIYRQSDAATSTPTSDGKSIYVLFPEFGLISYSLADGRERWRHPLGAFDNFYGLGASPVVAGEQVLVLWDQTSGSFLLSVDRATGRQRWKTARPESKEGWSTPIVHEDQILTFGTTRVDSYHLSTGEPRWWVPLSSQGSVGIPVVFGKTLLVSADGFEQPWLPSFAATIDKLDKNHDGKLSIAECKDEKDWFEHFAGIDADHNGLIDEPEWNEMRNLGVGEYGAMSISLDPAAKGQRQPGAAIKWRVKRGVPYVSSPLLYDGVFYLVKDGGIVSSLDPATGAILKQGRAARGQYFSSPVAADGKVFLLSEEGRLTVLKAGPQWEVLKENELGDECYATPAIRGGMLFVRTKSALYAFRQQ